MSLFQTVTKVKLFKYETEQYETMFVSKYDNITLETVTGISKFENYFKL